MGRQTDRPVPKPPSSICSTKTQLGSRHSTRALARRAGGVIFPAHAKVWGGGRASPMRTECSPSQHSVARYDATLARVGRTESHNLTALLHCLPGCITHNPEGRNACIVAVDCLSGNTESEGRAIRQAAHFGRYSLLPWISVLLRCMRHRSQWKRQVGHGMELCRSMGARDCYFVFCWGAGSSTNGAELHATRHRITR